MNTLNYKILIKVLPFLFFLGACQNDPAPTAEETEEFQEEMTENVDEEETENEEREEVDEMEYLYEINPETFSVVSLDEDQEDDLVLLTFDDAPYGNSLEIADALEAKDLSAIFFVNGMYMEEDEGFEVIQDLHARGFEIGNHTHTHLNLSEQSEETQKEEIVKTNQLIEEATGESPRFFRAPFGVMTDYSKSLLEELGMTWMNWSFGYDWLAEYQDADALTEITLNSPYLSNGANILMHDREWTAAAVPAILDGLDEQGYQMVDPKFIINPADNNE